MADNEINVLLIEDNPGDVRLVSMMLQASQSDVSFRLESCDRLDAGLKRLEKGGIDALMLDLSLPDSHGIETFERLREASPSLPIVLFSNLDDESTAIRAVAMGAQDYLIKGRVDGRSLGLALRFAVERHKKRANTDNGHGSAPGKVIALVGAKGGVGTSTVALNLAAAFAKSKKSALAVEFRPNFGTFSCLLRQVAVNNLGSLLELDAKQITPIEVSSRLVTFASYLKVLFGPQTPKEFREIEPEKAELLLALLPRLADYLVIDLPDLSSRASQIAARHCNVGVLVIDTDPVSRTCANNVLEQFTAAGISRTLLKAIVVNRTPDLAGTNITEIGKQINCELLGAVPPAAEICLQAQKLGSPFVIAEPLGLASGALSAMAFKLLTDQKLPVKAQPIPS